MRNKLTELAVDHSFERIVYKGKNGTIVYVLFAFMAISLFACLFALNNLKVFRFYTILYLIPFISSLFLLYLHGNKCTKKQLKTKFFELKKRSRAYRNIVKRKINSSFMNESGEFNKMKIDEAVIILENNYSKIRSEYTKIGIVFTGIFGVVWLQFIENIFSFFQFKNVLEIVELAAFLFVFCSFIVFGYFVARTFLISTKLGKIENFIEILQEVEYENRK